jgi:hypothetical protein
MAITSLMMKILNFFEIFEIRKKKENLIPENLNF